MLEVVVERKDDASVWSATYAAKCEPGWPFLACPSIASACLPANSIETTQLTGHST